MQHPAPDISAEQLTLGRSLLFSAEFRLNVSRRVLCSGLARADGCTLLQSTHRCAKVQGTTAVSYNNQK